MKQIKILNVVEQKMLCQILQINNRMKTNTECSLSFSLSFSPHSSIREPAQSGSQRDKDSYHHRIKAYPEVILIDSFALSVDSRR